MTPESLRFALERGTEESIVELLAGATEKERKAASGIVIEKLERETSSYVARGIPAAQARRLIFQIAALERRWDGRPLLALLGTGTFGEIKRYSNGPPPAKAFDVFAAREPKWLRDWCGWVLMQNHMAWPVVRRLVREGLCERPNTDQYYLYMIHGGSYCNPRQLLESDPALLEHELWELFRRQGIREASLAQDYFGWSDTLVAMSAEGKAPRERLLDASLEALELPFKPYHTTWYRNFHEALKPTIQERAARLPIYLALSSSPIPATVKFALKAIETVEKAGALPVEDFLAAAPQALGGKEKGPAATVLRLLERALAADPSQKRRIGEVSALGLEHPAADIQAAALELIRKLGVDDMEMEELIGSRLGLASAPVRERARQQMGKEGSVAVERYTPNWQRPDPIEREAPIRPIEDVEELVLTLTRVMNQAGPPDDVERVLDGVSRLCAERPPRFDDLTSALRTQVSKMFESDFMPHFGGVFSVQTAMAQLAAAWLLGKLVVKLGDNSQLLHAAMGARVYWVAFRARSGKVRALLSAPTHEGGWIDPRTLVDRMKTDRCAADDRECEADLIQALFRLTPGHRDEASEAAAMLPGESGKVVRYALGASAEPRDTELWAAARESREPRSSAYELRFHSDKHNPEQLRATMAVHPEPVRGYLRLADVFPGETQAINRTVPGLWAYADPLLRLGSAMPDLIAWASQMCPGNRDGWCAHGAFRLANNLDWYSANWGNRIFLSAFEDSYCEMTRPACLLLALGLMAREATEFDSSRDGFIRVIGDGRLDCERFGAELAGLFAQGVCKGTRLNRAMTETARVSSRHADAVRRILEHALAKGMPQRPADQSALLEAFLEACTAAGAGPESGDLRRLLEGMSGSGKGPKLARAIMALL